MGQVTKVCLPCYRVFAIILGHESGHVLLPGLSIAKPGNKTGAYSWPDPYNILSTSRPELNVWYFPNDTFKYNVDY